MCTCWFKLGTPIFHSNACAMNRLPDPPKPMRKTLLVLATFLLSGSVQAEWVLLGRNEDFRIYLDQELIRKNGDLAQIWQLMDFASAQWADPQTAVGSIKNLVEYDCSQPRLRTLSGTAYSERMAAGKAVANEQFANPQWENIAPGSSADKVQQLACGKKK